jgi:hypothetical protein
MAMTNFKRTLCPVEAVSVGKLHALKLRKICYPQDELRRNEGVTITVSTSCTLKAYIFPKTLSRFAAYKSDNLFAMTTSQVHGTSICPNYT